MCNKVQVFRFKKTFWTLRCTGCSVTLDSDQMHLNLKLELETFCTKLVTL